MRIIALKDGVTAVVEAKGKSVRDDHGVQGAKLAHRVFGFELEVSGQDLTGGIVLKAQECEMGAAALEPVMTAGIGERHHAEARTRAGAGSDSGAVCVSAERLVSQPARCSARFRGQPRDPPRPEVFP